MTEETVNSSARETSEQQVLALHYCIRSGASS